MSRAHSLRALVVAACLIVLLAGCGGGGGKGPSLSGGFGKIIGTVTDSASTETTRAPSSPITVEVDGTDISAQAGSDGRFALNRVPVGMHTLIARTEGRACALVVDVESDQETDIGEIELSDAGQISGLVTSAQTHKPISGALVTVAELVFTAEDEMPHPVRVCHTSASGSYTVSALPVGDYLVTISKAGYQECSLELAVEAGATTPGDAALAPDVAAETGALSGTVYLRMDSGDPTPLAGVLVRVTPKDEPVEIQPLPDDAIDEDGDVVDLYPDDSDVPPPPPPPLKSGDSTMPVRFSDEYYAFSDENGQYSIDGIPAGEYTAMAVRPGLQPDRQPVTITANAVATQDFILTLITPKFGVIEGTVTDAATKSPVVGASVRAIIGPSPLPADRSPGQRGEAGEGGVISPDPGHCVMFAITDENGHYSLKVPAVARGVVVRAEGYQPKRVEITLVPGQTLVVDVELTPAGAVEKFTLSGKVTIQRTPDGPIVPAAEARVTATPSVTIMGSAAIYPPIRFTATTDADGNYALELPQASYSVVASKGELRSDEVDLDISEDTVRDFLIRPEEVPEPPPPPP